VAHDCELTENRLSRDVDQWLDQIAARQRLGWVVGVRRAGSELPEPMRRKVDHECVDGHLLSAGKAAALVRLSNGLTAKRFHPIRCWLSRHNASAQLRALVQGGVLGAAWSTLRPSAAAQCYASSVCGM